MPAAKKTKGVDVRKPSDVKALQEILKAHPITIILVHADWCGHCQRYKENVWSKLEEMPEKKNGLAAIHHDQLENTEFADAKIRGYPSVIVVGKKKMAEFEDEEGPTNAIPNQQANDLETMESLARSAEPSTLTGTLPSMKSNVDTAEEVVTPDESPQLSEEAKTSREASLYNATPKKAVRRSASPLAVPDPTKDTLDSQVPAESETTEFRAAEEVKKGGGGSLYDSLLAAARGVAPAAALVATAVVLNKKGGKKRKTKRGSKRKGTKRRRATRKN